MYSRKTCLFKLRANGVTVDEPSTFPASVSSTAAVKETGEALSFPEEARTEYPHHVSTYRGQCRRPSQMLGVGLLVHTGFNQFPVNEEPPQVDGSRILRHTYRVPSRFMRCSQLPARHRLAPRSQFANAVPTCRRSRRDQHHHQPATCHMSFFGRSEGQIQPTLSDFF